MFNCENPRSASQELIGIVFIIRCTSDKFRRPVTFLGSATYSRYDWIIPFVVKWNLSHCLFKVALPSTIVDSQYPLAIYLELRQAYLTGFLCCSC